MVLILTQEGPEEAQKVANLQWRETGLDLNAWPQEADNELHALQRLLASPTRF